ncbi:MAG: hypothetical protein BWY74_02117 [Firmicutes bacterium ADurb.Bin419]|nr:MAG: hypothetical protein BWY74_02117 [Firmicutes bacterium ADurb.Bin419]
MDKIKVIFMYPLDSINGDLEDKELELNQIELLALLNSDKVGSEGSYYRILCKSFEDTAEGILLHITLIKDV